MDIAQLKARLSGNSLFHGIEHHASTGSTNDRALALARLGAPEGFLVTADSQSAGRGRLQRQWRDVPGRSLLVSIVLRPGFPPSAWPLIGLAAAVSTARAVSELGGICVRVKWPNDVVTEVASGPAKLAGILVEAEAETAIVGIGVNVLAAPGTPADAALPPICIADLTERVVSREDLLVHLMREFGPAYRSLERGDTAAVADAFCALDITKGRTVTLTGPGGTVTGRADGVDELGRILIVTQGARRAFAAGDLTVSFGAVDEASG